MDLGISTKDSIQKKNTEIFVLTDNLVLDVVIYKGTSKTPLLFEIFLHLHQVQMKVDLILHIIHIAGTRMIHAEIDGLY